MSRPVPSRLVRGNVGRLELYRCYAAVDCDLGLLRLFTNEIHYSSYKRKEALV